MSKIENPYNKDTEEGKYYAFESGLTSLSKEECPFEAGTLEYDEYYSSWMLGFSSGQKNRGSNKPPQKKAKGPVVFTSELEKLTDSQLIEELKKRKLQEYEDLLKQEQEIQAKIAKLKFLFE